MGCVLVVLATLVSVVGSIMLLVAAFRVSVGWGLAVLFIPFAALVFAVKYWEQAKLGFLISVGGNVTAMVIVFATGLSAALPDLRGRYQQPVAPQGGMAEATPPASEAPPTMPPPTPAATPTQFIQAFVDYTPPPRHRSYLPTPERAEDFVLTLESAAKRIGWTMHVTTGDGREFEGVLLAADERSLTFQRQLGGGSMVFSLPKSDIRKLELKQ